MNELGNTPADKNYQPSGITRAEEIALEKYPHNVYGGTLGDSLRAACMVGYHQAEKDLALTWEDIKRIHEIADDVWDEYVDDSFANFELEPMKEQEYYEKILNRFNNGRK